MRRRVCIKTKPTDPHLSGRLAAARFAKYGLVPRLGCLQAVLAHWLGILFSLPEWSGYVDLVLCRR